MTRFLHRMALGLLMALVALSLAAPAAQAKKTWEKIKVPVLGEVNLPEYERVELDNGMVLFLTEDHEFPLVELSATIRVGNIYESVDKVGLAGMTGSVLRTGGTEAMSGDEIDELVEAKGLRLNTWIGQTSGGAYLSALTEDSDLGLELLADILRRPIFDPDKIALAKEEQKASISRRNDEPMSIVRREAPKVLYGEDHPLARHPEYDTIAAVSRDDMIAFHEEYFHPDRMYLVVIGDFVSAEMVSKIEELFGDWPQADTPLPPDPEIPDLPRTVNVIDKEDLTQTTVLLGHKGIRNDDPNYAAIVVGNRILGGGFGDRLFNVVRSQHGYAYSVGSRAGTGWRYPGTFMAFTMTKNATVEAATDLILAEIEKMTREPVTEEELQQAKDGILAAEVFSYDTKREVLDRLVLFEMEGYPADFLQNYQAAVQELTADQILEATAATWHPEQLTILALGNPAEWDGDLSKYGPINEIDITIPEPSLDMDIPLATPKSLEQGATLLAGVAAASGGKKNFADLDGYFETSLLNANLQGMDLQFTIEKTVAFPDHQHTVQKTPFGNMSQVLAGDVGWSVSPRGAKDLSGDEVADAKRDMAGDMVSVLKNLDQMQGQALEPTEVEGVACTPVYVTGEAIDFQIIYVDNETGLVRMVQTKGTHPVSQAPVTQKVMVDAYGNLGGFKLPTEMRILFDDEFFGTVEVQDFQANPTIDKSLFEKTG